MGEIINNPEGDTRRVVVKMSIADLLNRPYFIQDGKGLTPHSTGDIIADAIRRVGWLMLLRHAPKIANGSPFPFGDVEELPDGKVQITFYREKPMGPPPPSAP